MTDDTDSPHRRYNPLNDSWVLVSPHRTQRPWLGQRETAPVAVAEFDPDCYLCPGNVRAGGQRNPDYPGVHIFDNDFPALLAAPTVEKIQGERPPGLFQRDVVAGCCRVICYSPDHSLTMAHMDTRQLAAVIDAWRTQHAELSRTWLWVQIFENRGQTMGCSNPHPHGQIWATDYLPQEGARELAQQQRHFEVHQRPLLADYAEQELLAGERVIAGNDAWLAVVPWWAVWPFEALIIARQPLQRMSDIDDMARDQLAALLKNLCSAYDQLFATPFPYSMGWHSAPGRAHQPGWRLHAHVYPPLLRSAAVRKFMVGFELLSEPQRDLTPETAAAALRQVITPP